MAITVAEDNFMGEPGVQSIPMYDPDEADWGASEETDLTPITNRENSVYSGSWDTCSWAVIVGDTLYYKDIPPRRGELPPAWATHIYKPLVY